LTPPLKWHGGKHYLAPKIVALMPPHLHYVEPFAGGLAVLLAKEPEGVSDVANDLDGDLVNFWRVMQSGDDFGRFRRVVEAVAPRPVNALVNSDFATVEELASVGVRRISVGGALARAAWTGFLAAAREIREQGTFTALGRAIGSSQLEPLLGDRDT